MLTAPVPSVRPKVWLLQPEVILPISVLSIFSTLPVVPIAILVPTLCGAITNAPVPLIVFDNVRSLSVLIVRLFAPRVCAPEMVIRPDSDCKVRLLFHDPVLTVIVALPSVRPMTMLGAERAAIVALLSASVPAAPVNTPIEVPALFGAI